MTLNNAHNATIGEELTFAEILGRYSVEIPKIQRDYVQGRNTAHAIDVRDNLLNDIKNVLISNADTPSINLGFVYGKISSKGSKLIPLDGQQRLTLLFLFHVFAFANVPDGCNWLNKFSYETRHSSKRFIEELVKNRAVIFAQTPSNIIKDAAWFQDEWILDPTVQSMLVVLDAIYLNFKDIQGIGPKLTEERKVVIMFLPMGDLGLEDSLYIKLNARGRPLTDWENYKAELVDRVEKVLPTTAKAFERKLDCKWTDLFWQMSNNQFDEAFKRFFDVQMSNYGKSNLLKLGADEIKAFEHCLDYLSDNLQDCSARETLKACCIGNNTYEDKILLHAITVYMAASEGKNKNSTFEAWMRVFRNLALNSVFNNEDAYRRACDGILLQKSHFDTLREDLSNGTTTFSGSGFRGEQIDEEILKAKLMQSDARMADEIFKAERHPYFDGNIAGILYFAGYSIANAEADAKDDDKFAALEKYAKKMNVLFSCDRLSCDPILFRRALLSVGDYLIPQNKNHTFCADAKDSRASWKVFLRSEHKNDGAHPKTDQRDYLETLLDRLDFTKSIDTQLKEVLILADIKESDWRWPFVKMESVDKPFLAYVGQSHWAIRYDNDWRNIALLQTQQLKGYWHCAGILALWCALRTKGINCKYHYGKGYLWRDSNWYLDGFDSSLNVQKISINIGFDIIRRDGTKETVQKIEEVIAKIGNPLVPI
jgi:hypothetical protein